MTDLLQAQAHLLTLQGAGIGVRQAAKLAGVSVQTVCRVRSGSATAAKPETVAAILGVTVKRAPGARVNAYPTRRLLRALMAEGFTERELARRLGLQRGRIEWNDRTITERNARKVRALWARVTEGE